jgi:hypothetical protein
MSALVGAELLKLRTTRAWIGFVLIVVALSGISSAAAVGSAQDSVLGTSELSREILSGALFASLIAFLIGVMSVTSEWRHGTVTRTFLVTPRRERVLVAKELSILLVAFGLAALGIAIALVVAVPWLFVENSSLALSDDLVPLIGQIVAASMLWGALGVGVGAVVQSQTPALVGSILWILLVEALIQALLGLIDLEAVAHYLPGQALSAFDGTLDEGLPVWAGGVVGLAWVAALGALGYVRMSRQDVT